MNEFICEVKSFHIKHDRFGNASLKAWYKGGGASLLVPASRAIPSNERALLYSIMPGDVVHAQGTGDYLLSMVYKVPSDTDRFTCACGNYYHSDEHRVWCSNPACSRTSMGQLCYFIRSYFQNKLTRSALENIEPDMVFIGITSLSDLFMKNTSGMGGIATGLVSSVRQMISKIKLSRDVFDQEQNAFWLSFLDSLGLPNLRLSDLVTIMSNESIDHQNGEGGESAQYYYHVLTTPEYLAQITDLPGQVCWDVSKYVTDHRLGNLFGMLSRFDFENDHSLPWEDPFHEYFS